MKIKEIGIEGVYVVHGLEGYEHHRIHIEKLFAEQGLEYEFQTSGALKFYTETQLSDFFSEEFFRHNSRGATACGLNHLLIYEKVVERKNRYALVFEDDVFFLTDVQKFLLETADELHALPPGFILSLENTSLTFPDFSRLKRGKRIYEANRGRMAGAYLIDAKAAQIMLDYWKKNKCGAPIDLWHNQLCEAGLLKIYWLHPPIAEQGSHNGLLSGGKATKEQTFKRRLRWLAQKWYKQYFRHYWS
jgi:glycosyl transferase family 25